MLHVVKGMAKISLNKFAGPTMNLGYRMFTRYLTKASQSNVTHQGHVQSDSHPTFGQPTSLTHPYLIKEGELIPGIKLEEFKNRRSKLIEKIISHAQLENNPTRSQIIIIPSASKVYMSDKIPYVFRQNTDFLYFTGCQEPDSVLVIIGKEDNFFSTLFVQKKDPHSELWDGPKTGVEIAAAMFGVEQALPVTEFERYFTSFVDKCKDCVVWLDNTDAVQPGLQTKIHQFIKRSNVRTLESLKMIIHNIRLIKSQSEINLMQKSCDLAAAAIAKTIQISKPGMSEHQLFATVDYECRMNGAEYMAYPPVVAGGRNANIIHYILNNQIIQAGDMVLMDAGCEYHGYSSDITRTWPINGSFTPQQLILYEIVLEVQNTLIKSLKEIPTLDQIFQHMCLLLGKRLQEVNLIPKDLEDEKLISAAYSYCPHHVSHYLGMDVHDTGTVCRSIKVKPGMIITIEPGVYVNARNKFAPPEFHDLGIRIEDDVLITNDGPVVLSRNCPKEIVDIENLAKQNQF